jgi:predicted Zn-dependent protease
MPPKGKIFGILFLCCGALAAQDAAREAGVAREANRLDEAVLLYRKAVAENPKWTEGWWYLGTLLYDRDDYAGAARAFEKTCALDSSNGGAQVMLGLTEAKLNKNADALEHLRNGRKLGIPDDPQLRQVTLFTLGTLWLERGIRSDFEDAQEALDALARQGVESEELTDALGLAVLYTRPPGFDPQLVRAAGRAEILAARRQVADALTRYKQLAADYPKVSGVQFAYGKFLLAHNEDAEALEVFQREIQNTPNHVLARLCVAGVIAQNSAQTSAQDPASESALGLRYAQEALKLAPELPEAHYLVGVLQLDAGEPLRAIAELESAQRAEPEEAKVYFALSRAYAKVNRKEDAARARATFARLNAMAPHE